MAIPFLNFAQARSAYSPLPEQGRIRKMMKQQCVADLQAYYLKTGKKTSMSA